MYVVYDFKLGHLTHFGQCFHLIPIVLAWVLIPQAKHDPVIFSVSSPRNWKT